MTDTITDPIGYDRLAFALVVALHNEETEAAALMLEDLVELNDDGTYNLEPLHCVCVVLALTLNEAWMELCEADGVTFDEFAATSGMWLAGGDV